MGITVDPSDYRGLIKLMDKASECGASVLSGTSDKGEPTLISLSGNSVTITTFQDNGWTRENTYYRDGTEEELFLERWQING